jgi:polyisoprenyl-phosphate glycosyltransferase
MVCQFWQFIQSLSFEKWIKGDVSVEHDSATSNKNISVVIPVFNNYETIEPLVQTIIDEINKYDSSIDIEIILVDDGSKDKSWSKIELLAMRNPKILCGIKLSRNFGQMAAMLAGWDHCSGDAIINLSADLQDPPSAIPSFIDKWRSGADLVVGIRIERNDGFFVRTTSKFAHKILSNSINEFPKTWFDYTLCSRRVLNVMLSMQGRHRFPQGEMFFAGFKREYVPYVRLARKFGKSGYNFWSRLKNFTDASLDSSYGLIQLFIRSGFLVSLGSIVYALWIVIARSLGLISETGWAPIMFALMAGMGIIMTMLGVITEYLWRIYDLLRAKPAYVVDIKLNLNQ